MASEVSICNLALQKVGASRINSLTEDSNNAKECNACYETIRDRELRKYTWSFAKARALLAPDADAPSFEYTYAFTLPADMLRKILVNDTGYLSDGECIDYIIEGDQILTSDTTTLYLWYIKQVTDPNMFDTLFIDLLACAIARQICEKLTQSNTKTAAAEDAYQTALAEAQRVGAIEKPTDNAPDDEYITARD